MLKKGKVDESSSKQQFCKSSLCKISEAVLLMLMGFMAGWQLDEILVDLKFCTNHIVRIFMEFMQRLVNWPIYKCIQNTKASLLAVTTCNQTNPQSLNLIRPRPRIIVFIYYYSPLNFD